MVLPFPHPHPWRSPHFGRLDVVIGIRQFAEGRGPKNEGHHLGHRLPSLPDDWGQVPGTWQWSLISFLVLSLLVLSFSIVCWWLLMCFWLSELWSYLIWSYFRDGGQIEQNFGATAMHCGACCIRLSSQEVRCEPAGKAECHALPPKSKC